ncbi:acyl-CoA dehydrogenase family protein [Nocardia sp. CA-135398]|uniref:acyl-CoA dehydrogenase family protein n=1 Tax=Nocardia sp. CA-135398 TaxID=3239977 RepID=UPI003D9776BE
MDSVFDYLLTETPDPTPLESITDAWTRHRATADRFDTTVDIAIAGGFGADRLGFAFLSGYQQALRALLPDLSADELVAVSATEAGGAHPSAIATPVTETDGRWRVNGTKTFTTLGILARRLLVIASAGTSADGRNRLRAVLVDAAQPGVDVTNLPVVPFAPEIPHASVTFTDVAAEPLPGDGYSDYLKPFRTIEDVHVLAATLGWLMRVGRESGWPRATLQRLLAAVAFVRGLDMDQPTAPGGHIALGGAYAYFEQVLTELEPQWAQADPVVRERWKRDRRLLATAGKVRAQRLTAAWQSVGMVAGAGGADR